MTPAIEPCSCERCEQARWEEESERPLIPDKYAHQPVHYVREFEALNHLKPAPLDFPK
jgi:hypothetical protein